MTSLKGSQRKEKELHSKEPAGRHIERCSFCGLPIRGTALVNGDFKYCCATCRDNHPTAIEANRKAEEERKVEDRRWAYKKQQKKMIHPRDVKHIRKPPVLGKHKELEYAN